MFERRFIEVNRSNEKEVLTALHELGYKWSSGQQILRDGGITFTCWDSEYNISISEEDKVILWYSYSNKKRYKKITLEELKEESKPKRCIKTLKDLDGLKNKNGLLEIRYDKTEGYEECIFVRNTTGKNTTSIEIIKKEMILLKWMGFEFEWINRTKEEIEEEIEQLSKPYSSEYRNVIKFIDGEYKVLYSSVRTPSYPTSRYLSYKDAKRLSDELNRLGD